jgi:hypothetical protein
VHRLLAAALMASAAALAGCTSSGSPAPTTSTEFQTITQTRPAPTPKTSGPVSTGPTTAADVSSCPLLDKQSAADTVGMRLERVAVLKADGKLVGCRFYALQGSPLAVSEHLPGPNQPAIEITATRYPDATSVRAAFIALAEKGRNVQRATISDGNVGLCFQTDFYAMDHGADWACAYGDGPTLVLVKTVVTSPALNAIEIAKAVAPKF